MAEDLGPGCGETASIEMLPEDGGCRPKARAGLASRSSSARWALTCCLVLLPILAGLTTYLLVGQLRAQGEACVFQVSKTPQWPGGQQTPWGHLATITALDRASWSIMVPASICKGKVDCGRWRTPTWFLFSVFLGDEFCLFRFIWKQPQATYFRLL